jgi:hypothetical protein
MDREEIARLKFAHPPARADVSSSSRQDKGMKPLVCADEYVLLRQQLAARASEHGWRGRHSQGAAATKKSARHGPMAVI